VAVRAATRRRGLRAAERRFVLGLGLPQPANDDKTLGRTAQERDFCRKEE